MELARVETIDTAPDSPCALVLISRAPDGRRLIHAVFTESSAAYARLHELAERRVETVAYGHVTVWRARAYPYAEYQLLVTPLNR
jgi:hypothetical protein